MTELSEAFFITLIATVSAMFGLSLRMCLRSRCERVECCCFKVQRAVELEHDEAQDQPNNSVSDLELGEIYKKDGKITL